MRLVQNNAFIHASRSQCLGEGRPGARMLGSIRLVSHLELVKSLVTLVFLRRD